MSDRRADDEHGERGHDDHHHGHADHGGHHHDDHRGHHHHDVDTVCVAVVTVSSSRSIDDDPSGDAIIEAVEGAGHDVVHRELVVDDFDTVQGVVSHLSNRDDVDAVVTTGGTGVTPDDVTIDAVESLLEQTLPGFGELFRRLSYDEVGTRVVGTRATAGVVDGVVVFCLPGSENAARLGVEDIILPEVGHLVGLVRRGGE